MRLFWPGQGLRRLGLEHHITQRLGPPDFLPAVGQGALGLECRRDDAMVVALVKPLNDDTTYRAVLAERADIGRASGWLHSADGRLGSGSGGNEGRARGCDLAIDAAVFDPDGRERIRISLQGPRA